MLLQYVSVREVSVQLFHDDSVQAVQGGKDKFKSHFKMNAKNECVAMEE